MKLLLGHAFYRSSAPSGEDAVYRNERALLEQKGIDVVPYEKFNDDIDDSTLGRKVKVALNTAWSGATYDELSKLIRRTRPEVAHFHNTFPSISPSAYAACQDHGVPVVQTLHNFRFVCPGAMLQRAGQPCEACIGTSLLPALKHRCYRDSFAATGALVWMVTSNRWRGTYSNLVNRYIALTKFAAAKLVAGGLPADCMEVKPNFLPSVSNSHGHRGDYAVYVGRLSGEKGVRTLLAAWQDVGDLPLKILGDGPLRAELEQQARQQNLAIEFLGFRAKEEILNIVGRARFQIVPSEWYEGFPMVILEAFASGTPVIASRIGSLDEIVTQDATGVKFTAGDARDLAEKVNGLRGDYAKIERMGFAARAVFEEHYTADSSFSRLMDIYRRATENLRTPSA